MNEAGGYKDWFCKFENPTQLHILYGSDPKATNPIIDKSVVEFCDGKGMKGVNEVDYLFWMGIRYKDKETGNLVAKADKLNHQVVVSKETDNMSVEWASRKVKIKR